jgi:hypothetical protein
LVDAILGRLVGVDFCKVDDKGIFDSEDSVGGLIGVIANEEAPAKVMYVLVVDICNFTYTYTYVIK